MKISDLAQAIQQNLDTIDQWVAAGAKKRGAFKVHYALAMPSGIIAFNKVDPKKHLLVLAPESQKALGAKSIAIEYARFRNEDEGHQITIDVTAQIDADHKTQYHFARSCEGQPIEVFHSDYATQSASFVFDGRHGEHFSASLAANAPLASQIHYMEERLRVGHVQGEVDDKHFWVVDHPTVETVVKRYSEFVNIQRVEGKLQVEDGGNHGADILHALMKLPGVTPDTVIPGPVPFTPRELAEAYRQKLHIENYQNFPRVMMRPSLDAYSLMIYWMTYEDPKSWDKTWEDPYEFDLALRGLDGEPVYNPAMLSMRTLMDRQFQVLQAAASGGLVNNRGDHSVNHLVETLLPYFVRDGKDPNVIKTLLLKWIQGDKQWLIEMGHQAESLGLLLACPTVTWTAPEQESVRAWFKKFEYQHMHFGNFVDSAELAHYLSGLRLLAANAQKIGL